MDMRAFGHRRTIGHLQEAITALEDLRDATQYAEICDATPEDVEAINQLVDEALGEASEALALLDCGPGSSTRLSRAYVDKAKRTRDACVLRARGDEDVIHPRDYWPIFDKVPDIRDPTGGADNLLAALAILSVLQDEMEGDQHQADVCYAEYFIASAIDIIWPIREERYIET